MHIVSSFFWCHCTQETRTKPEKAKKPKLDDDPRRLIDYIITSLVDLLATQSVADLVLLNSSIIGSDRIACCFVVIGCDLYLFTLKLLSNNNNNNNNNKWPHL